MTRTRSRTPEPAAPRSAAAGLWSDAADVVAKQFRIVGDDPRVDLLTIAAKVRFEAAWPRRLVRRVEGVRIPYLHLDDLIASKQTGRHSDEADLEVLRGLRRREPR